MTYLNVKSKLIKEKIKNASWKKDRESIGELIFLEKVILDFKKTGAYHLGWSGSMAFNAYKNGHKKEYLELLKELDIDQYKYELKWKKQEKKEEAKEKEEDRKDRLREKREIADEKRQWKKMGGRL